MPSQGDHLDFWFLDSKTSKWIGLSRLKTGDGKEITSVTGDPALIQSSWDKQGNFELLVLQGQVINHYYRDNDDPQMKWHQLTDRTLSYFTFSRSHQLGSTPLSVRMFQSNYKGDGVHGNFEAIVRVKPPVATQGDHLDFWFLDSKISKMERAIPLEGRRQRCHRSYRRSFVSSGFVGEVGKF